MSKRAAGGRNPAHILFEKHLTELGIPIVKEVRFHPLRKWRWDYVVYQQYPYNSHGKIAIEIDGFHNGRHGAGWGADNDKQNAGIMDGWMVLRFSTTDVLRGRAKAFLQQHLGQKGREG